MNWLLRPYFPKFLRDAVRALKAENDFRPKGLSVPKWSAVIYIFLATGLAILGAFTGYEWWVDLAVLAFMIFITALIQRHHAWKDTLLYSCGAYTRGVVTIRSLIPGKNWTFGYQFETPHGTTVKGNAQFVMAIEFPNQEMPKKGDEVWVFYNPEAPHQNNMFIPSRFGGNCISLSRYKQFISDLGGRDHHV